MDGRDQWLEQTRRETAATGHGPSSTSQAKWTEHERHTERVSKSRKEWFNSLKTSDQPYLRLALVVGSRDGKGKR